MRMQAAALARLPEAACVLVNTIEKLEENVVKARQQSLRSYIPVGPLIGSSSSRSINQRPADDVKCLQWLDRQAPRSILYIAFGSVFSPAAREVEKIVRAVEETEQPVLWAMRGNLATDDDGTGDFREMAARATGRQGMVVEWTPQLRVLQHPSTGGFLTHCGWSSTLEAVISGVPTICWPLAAEQNWNAMVMAEEWKIGINLLADQRKPEDVEVGSIVSAIRCVMHGKQGDGMRHRAAEVREIARAALEQDFDLVSQSFF